MRIAFLGDGSLIHVRRWAGFFHERGHEILLFSFEDTSGCPFPAVRLHRRLPTRLAGYLASLPRLRREIKRFDPQILNALYVSGYGLLGSMAGARRLVVSALGSDMLVDYPSNIIHRIQIRKAIKASDLVTTDADSLSEAVVEAGGIKDRILKVFFGVDENIFHPPAENRSAPGGPDRLEIISTRNLYDIYNVDLLLDAAVEIAEATDVHFTICGDGPLRGSLEAKAMRIGLADRFTFTGRLKAAGIADRLRRADIYVSTSISDSTSVSLLEAMACGALPVVTDIPANREWITDMKNGRLTASDSPSMLARTILEIAAGGEDIERFRERNLGIVAEKALWSRNMETLEQAFERLARS